MSRAPVSTLLLGSAPERLPTSPPLVDRVARQARRWRDAVCRPSGAAPGGDATAPLADLRARIARDPRDRVATEAALTRVASTCAEVLGLVPFPTQLDAARSLLRGELVEMATGEGKTLAVGLAAACGALAGRPVHVVTANDYLARRDSEWLAPLYRRLELTCSHVTAASDREARRQAYASDITYCPGREVVFDYLRDRLFAPRPATPLLARIAAMGGVQTAPERLLRGLWMAIVDEADSVLLDEALMPLVLSGPVPTAEDPEVLALACTQARGLSADDEDYVLDPSRRQARLTERGIRRLREDVAVCARYRTRLHQVEYVETALAALHVYQRDRDYLVRNDGVQIIDEATGRAAPGRIWSRELHAFVSLKEGCTPPPRTRTVTQITFQSFFPRYLHLCGTSGTLREERHELASVYGLPVTRVARRLPDRLQRWPTRLYPDTDAQLAAVVARADQLRQQGRPVLIAMDSVAQADAIAARLLRAGIEHQVLHARQDELESEQIACAGASGQVTVTTNIAGRGTDILLDPIALASGGLHVIACQYNRARRIDRQLSGRAARQGDPGSCERWISIEQDLFAQTWPASIARRIATRPWLASGRLADWLLDHGQRRAELRARATRQAMLERDRDRARELEIGPDR